ncbi:MAG TPA: response regulator [candidate division WOR-3 bacterium]|uniref:Response regulator n=1 Tax=candidate division WOR-3 bacterium TaxID=2052148 RepID=A0A7C1BF81_UNCW3|nr:response regulator [candidate division WOR-3 bacterium]
MAASKVLIVDDEEDILWGLSGELSRQGLEVMTASKGTEALDLLKKGKVDFLITDIRMPDISGVELLLKARELHPELKVIVMTAYGSEDIKNEVMRKGAISYLEKPFDFEQLLNLLKEKEKEKGTLAEWELTEVLQLLSMEGKTATIKVETSEGEGLIVMVEGEVYDSQLGKLRGEEAFIKILGHVSAPFQVSWEVEKPEKTIEKPLYALLLEAIAGQEELQTKEALKELKELLEEEEKLAEMEGLELEGEKEEKEEEEEEFVEEPFSTPPEPVVSEAGESEQDEEMIEEILKVQGKEEPVEKPKPEGELVESKAVTERTASAEESPGSEKIEGKEAEETEKTEKAPEAEEEKEREEKETGEAPEEKKEEEAVMEAAEEGGEEAKVEEGEAPETVGETGKTEEPGEEAPETAGGEAGEAPMEAEEERPEKEEKTPPETAEPVMTAAESREEENAEAGEEKQAEEEVGVTPSQEAELPSEEGKIAIDLKNLELMLKEYTMDVGDVLLTCIIDVDGRILSHRGRESEGDLAHFAERIRKMVAEADNSLRDTKWGCPAELLLTTNNYMLIVNKLGGEYFHVAVIPRKSGKLGMARVKFREFAKRFEGLLKRS